MVRILIRLISILVIIAIAVLALVEVYPDQMKQLEDKAGVSVVVKVQDFMDDMKNKLDKARTKDYQRDIEDIVNNEIVE